MQGQVEKAVKMTTQLEIRAQEKATCLLTMKIIALLLKIVAGLNAVVEKSVTVSTVEKCTSAAVVYFKA